MFPYEHGFFDGTRVRFAAGASFFSLRSFYPFLLPSLGVLGAECQDVRNG